MIKLLRKILFVSGCLIFLSSIGMGQLEFSIPIYVTNSASDSDTLILGVNTTATYEIDTALGEFELPPIPPTGVFDVRFVDIPGHPSSAAQVVSGRFDRSVSFVPISNNQTAGTGLGQGVKTDIRNLVERLQTDTFKIKFQPSTEGGDNVVFAWDAPLDSLGGGRWKIVSSLSANPTLFIDMVSQTSVTIDANEYSSFYIVKSDAYSYRTFSMEDYVLDTDDKGKRGKIVKAKSSQVEFCLSVVNDQEVAVNGMYMEFKTPIDSSRLIFSPFTTVSYDPKQKSTALTKVTFSGATVAVGETVSVCGWGVKSGTKQQAVSKYYWKVGSVTQGKPANGKLIPYSVNEVRLPLPNITTALNQAMVQAYPPKVKLAILYVGSTDGIPGVKSDTIRNVQVKKYTDVLKTLMKDYGSKGYLLQDTLADCLQRFDDKKNGYRQGKYFIKSNKTLPPDKHRNRLLGEALTLKINLAMSATDRTPYGLGRLFINDASSPFDGITLDSLATQADQFLTYCTITKAPSITADELADLLAEINSAFRGELDTVSWGGGLISFTGPVAVGDVPFLKRKPWLLPKSSGDFASLNNVNPLEYKLQQNYPNPFNPTTTIAFTLPEDGLASVYVYNMLGQVVATLADRTEFSSGENEIAFDARELSSGVYFYRIEVNDAQSGLLKFQETRKMILLK